MTTMLAPASSTAVEASLRSTLLAGTRPHRPSALSASLTFGWRALLKIKYMPEQMADIIAIPIIFTLLFTYLFGGALAGSTGAYLQFLLPGTLVMTVLLVTMYTGIGLNSDFTSGVFDRFRSMSIWRPAPIFGSLLGDVARYVLASSLVIALGLVLGFRPAGGVAGVLLAVALVLVFAFSLSWIWTALGLVVRSPNAVTSIGTVILFPLTLASNVFVEPKTMPGWLQAFVNINPASHLVIAVRGLMHGTATAGQVSWVLVASAVVTAIFFPLTMYLYSNKR
ncbi:MAG TPA: ABC transporter permease [Ktedonobacterales bacterium]